MTHSLIDNTILLFYGGFEKDSFFRNDRYLKRVIRPFYQLFSHRQKVSGFLVWHRLLVKALTEAGYRVKVDDYRFASRRPDYPIGITGYPSILSNWKLPNPAILGPGMFDHPSQCAGLMDDPRYKKYIVTCDWMRKLFEEDFGDACVDWRAGIDVSQWKDVSGEEKKIDFLIYDKIRWDRDRLEGELLGRVQSELASRGLTSQVLRYGFYDYKAYADALKNSRAMIFLCEHETQGMAYQECLASNIPILAWDFGIWKDPLAQVCSDKPIHASSVPYFSPQCGEKFRRGDDFGEVLDRFQSRLFSYQPRTYVENSLSFEISAQMYLKQYLSLLER